MWKNRRLDQLQKSLARHVEVYYRPNVDHPLYTAFQSFLWYNELAEEDTLANECAAYAYKRLESVYTSLVCLFKE